MSDSGLVDVMQARLLNRIKLLDNNFIKGGGVLLDYLGRYLGRLAPPLLRPEFKR